MTGEDLEGIVSYAAERDLILEVNTYMFPPLRRDPTMVGRNDRFTPAETAHYHMERYRLQRGEEDFTRFLPRPPVWTRTASTP